MGWVLFFDGDCAFCSASVRRVARFDKHGRIAFAPLQGRLSAQMDLRKYADNTSGTMVLLRESDGKLFFFSDSLIELAHALGGGWRFFTLARFIPQPVRDLAYRWVARNRYRIAGKADHCALPDPAVQGRLRE